MIDLKGKYFLVTGGGGVGVGRGVCDAIAECGGKLLINDLDEDHARTAAARYNDALPVCGDIANAEAVRRMFTTIEARGIMLGGIVNNAGIGLSKTAHETSEAEYDRLLHVDLRGVWLMVRAFTQHLLKQSGTHSGSIVNVSSVHAQATMSGYALYASTKAGVEGLTRGLAVELGAHNIRCNAIAPGYVHSEQNRDLIATWTTDPDAWIQQHTKNQQALNFEIEPLDCGWAVAFLLSDLSRAITGQTLRIDAGMTALLYNRDFI